MERSAWLWAAGMVSLSAIAAACAASEGNSGGGGGFAGTEAGPSGGAGGTGGSKGGAGGTGGSSGGTGGAAGSDASAGTGGTEAGTGGSDAGDGGPTTSVSGDIVSLTDPNTPVIGVQVCVYQAPSIPCVQTDSTGHYTLSSVPTDKEILVEYTKATYFPVLVTVKTSTLPLDLGQFRAPTSNEAAAFGALVGVSIDPSKGQVLFTAFTPATGGGYTGQDSVVAKISPQSGTGPYYLNAAGTLPDKTLTATTASGVGLFANVDSGDYDVTLTHFSKTCQRFSTSWVGSGSTASKVPVVKGYLTGGAAVECP